MTQEVDIANRAFQLFGTRTNITATELANAFAGLPSGPYTQPCSNEAINAALIMRKLRDELNRMAPWDFCQKWAVLTYITTTPGNPENANAGAPLWQPGTPAPPWNYEYQYPVDCLRARKIVPQYTAQAGGIPIYPAGTVTGAGYAGWTGPALRFKVATDQFFGVTAATAATGGSGYSVGDLLILEQPSYTFQQNSAPVGQPASLTSYTMDAGAPVILEVATVDGSGAVLTANVVNQVAGETQDAELPIGGSYYSTQTNPVSVGSSQSAGNPGAPTAGVNATFNLTFGSLAPQRVILCNIEQAILNYNCLITDPNVMDDLFQDAWINILGARLTFQLTGDKALANTLIGLANTMVMEARKADGNEGLTVNDITPDFLRIRGGYGVGPNFEYSPNLDFDWGMGFSAYL
jgi:hypothetical protein